MNRTYRGPPIDATEQYITERPELDDRDDDEDEPVPPSEMDGELDEEAEAVVYATEPEPAGQETTENVPIAKPRRVQRPDVTGQTTLEDWGGAARAE